MGWEFRESCVWQYSCVCDWCSSYCLVFIRGWWMVTSWWRRGIYIHKKKMRYNLRIFTYLKSFQVSKARVIIFYDRYDNSKKSDVFILLYVTGQVLIVRSFATLPTYKRTLLPWNIEFKWNWTIFYYLTEQ